MPSRRPFGVSEGLLLIGILLLFVPAAKGSAFTTLGPIYFFQMEENLYILDLKGVRALTVITSTIAKFRPSFKSSGA